MDGGASPHLKETLIAWLLMTDQSDELDESCRPHPIICRFFSKGWFSADVTVVPDGGSFD